jgi:hypothetical protein
MFYDNLSIDASVEGEKVSVQVEHLIDTSDVDNVVVQEAPIAEISPIIDDSSIVEHSSSVVQSPQHSIAAGRAKRQPKPLKRLIEECNVAYATSVTEEIEGDSKPSNYSEATTSTDCNN